MLFSTLYSELHRLAKRQLARQYSPERLGVTTLLHEVYLNMAKLAEASFPDRARFMGYAACVMRGLIGAMQMISERTVQRRWERARIYLHRSMSTDSRP